ncbi:hypothetical protein B5M09_001336 [Aphanomyces astaci]|uniref:Methyltransferase domain-containing protein n=1 Tax=Aphanomyces astaci TaxID=112090 RepID=A0A425D213_APHAT|nr:hypothetical protein B5M09_001336 [Aphanomyces astaci]
MTPLSTADGRGASVVDPGIARFQAVIRGNRSRKIHVERVKQNLGAFHDAVDAMLRLANVTAEDVVLDIGCGDGRIVFAAVDAPFSARHAIGVDIDPALIAQCQHMQHRRRPEIPANNVTFILDDWVHVDMSLVTVVTLFFLPHPSIATDLRAKCQPGTRIVTYVFEIGEWTPVATGVTVPFLKEHGESPLFLYQI